MSRRDDSRSPTFVDAAIHTSNFIVGVAKDDGTVFWTFPILAAAGPDFVPVNGVVDGAPRILSSGIAAKVVFLVRYTYQVPYPELGPGARGPLVASYVGVLDLYDVAGGGLRFHPYDEQKEFVDAHGGGGLGGSARLGPPADFPGPKLGRRSRLRECRAVRFWYVRVHRLRRSSRRPTKGFTDSITIRNSST